MQILLDHSTETIKTFTDLSTKGCMCVYTHHVVGLFEHQLLKISSYKAQILHWPSRNTCLIRKMCSPVKFVHSLPKKCRNTNASNRELCVICQITHPTVYPALQRREEILCLMRSTSDKMMLIVVCMMNLILWARVPLNEIKYHRSCYKAYTSKRNLQRFVSDVPECSKTSNDAF